MEGFSSNKNRKRMAAFFCSVMYILFVAAAHVVYNHQIQVKTTTMVALVLYYTSLSFVILFFIAGWVHAAYEFEKSFTDFKKTSDKDARPSGNYTLYAPISFAFIIIFWPFRYYFDLPD